MIEVGDDGCFSELSGQFGVTGIPALVVMKNGNIVEFGGSNYWPGEIVVD